MILFDENRLTEAEYYAADEAAAKCWHEDTGTEEIDGQCLKVCYDCGAEGVQPWPW